MSETAETPDRQSVDDLALSDPLFDPLFTTPQLVTDDSGQSFPLHGGDDAA